MANELKPNHSLTSGQQLIAGAGNRYVLTMQSNGVLVLLDTVTLTQLFASPNAPQVPPQGNVVCTMEANGLLKLTLGLGGAVICTSTNLPSPLSIGAGFFLEADGVGRIRKNDLPAGQVLWTTTQGMTLGGPMAIHAPGP